MEATQQRRFHGKRCADVWGLGSGDPGQVGGQVRPVEHDHRNDQNAWGSWKPRALVRMRAMAALLDSAIPFDRVVECT